MLTTPAGLPQGCGRYRGIRYEMIPADPSQTARRAGARYFRYRGRRRLAGIHAAGLEEMRRWDRRGSGPTADYPLVIVANHAGWWDALMPIMISLDTFDHDAYGVMEERQLVRFGFFRKLGMFSIDRENPRSALASLRYGADLLRDTNRVLWYFPQGEIVPNDRRPLEIQRGIGRLLEMIGRVTLLPVAFRYELMDNERPDAWIRVGPPTGLDLTSPAGTMSGSEIEELVRRGMTGTADRLREDVLERRTDEYRTILRGRRSIDEWWSDLRGNRSLHRRPGGFP